MILCLAAALMGVPASGALADGAPPGNLADGGALASGTPPSASSDGSVHAAGDSYDLFGAGYGHGVGLSQWGSYGLAAKGWGHRQILTHYYTGTSVGPAPSGVRPSVIRVGLVWDRTCCTLTAVGGPVMLRLGSPTKKDKFKIPNGYTWKIRPSSGKFKVFNAKGQAVGTVGGPNWSIFAVYQPFHSRVRIAEFGHSLSHGYLEMNVYRPCSSCSWYARAVGVMSPQKYLFGLGEVPSSWPMQSLEAQADAARSYAFNVIAAQGQHRSAHGKCNCGIYANTIDQAYSGYEKELDGPSWPNAVKETRNEVVLFNRRPIVANYTASSGGFTEDNDKVGWGDPVPYLRGVCDPGDYVVNNPSRIWNVGISSSAMSADLARYGYDVGTVNGFPSIVRSHKSGRIMSITIKGSKKQVTISGPTFRGVLGLRDDKVWINHDRNIKGSIRAKYDALMCDPGLAKTPQAWVPGGKVQRFADGAIYLRSGDGRALWSHGPVYRKYSRTGGARGLLGLPSSGIQELSTPPGCGSSGFCAREGFNHGRIYFKSGLGPAHELHGSVLRFYVSKGAAHGVLGFPTSNVMKVGNGSRRATFEHGTVTCDKTGACTKS